MVWHIPEASVHWNGEILTMQLIFVRKMFLITGMKHTVGMNSELAKLFKNNSISK